jgi:hypothetical protein
LVAGYQGEAVEMVSHGDHRGVMGVGRRLCLVVATLLGALVPSATQGEDEPTLPGRIFIAVSGRPLEFFGNMAIDPNTGVATRTRGTDTRYGRVSPDGRFLLGPVRDEVKKSYSLRVADLWDEAPSRLVFEGVGGPNWSSDGTKIVISVPEKPVPRGQEADSPMDTWRLDADGSNRVKLPIAKTEVVVDWSADGRWLLTYSDRRPPDAVAPFLLIKRPIYAVRIDGAEEHLLVPGVAGPPPGPKGATLIRMPRISPDGRRISYCQIVTPDPDRPQDTTKSLWVVDLDGTNRRRILGGGSLHPGSACWSPDGKWLAVETSEQNEGDPRPTLDGIRIVDLDGKVIKHIPVVPTPDVLAVLDWREMAKD